MEYDMDEMIHTLSTPMPTAQSEKKAEMDASKMKSDTQILLAIFEKVVCIEEKMEAAKPATPAVVSIPSSMQLEGEFQ